MKESLVKIKLSDVKPNPNRDLKFNPYNEEKIAALMASIGETGFWTNVILRVSPDGKGYEQSYGHHRLESARRCGIEEADFIVRDLDENMMLKMMELENQEDYRYCPLSLLESVKAVVNALAAGRIAPFYRVEDGITTQVKGVTKKGDKWQTEITLYGEKKYLGVFPTEKEAGQAYKDAAKGHVLLPSGPAEGIRYAPSFAPRNGTSTEPSLGKQPYTVPNISTFLGRAVKKGDTVGADKNTRAALDALYLLEVKAITTAMVKDMNWSQLGRFVADAKAHRERTVLRVVKTKDEIAKINAEALRIQAEQRTKEKTIADERAALVKKLAEAKRKEDAEKAQEIKERIVAKEEQAEKIAETFEVKKAALDVKVAEVKQKEMEAKKEDEYAPLRREVSRILSKLEGTTATTRTALEEEVKALARKTLNSNDREMLRQSAIKAGTWYTEFAAMQFLPPLTKRRAK
jgi:hypothetical protein